MCKTQHWLRLLHHTPNVVVKLSIFYVCLSFVRSIIACTLMKSAFLIFWTIEERNDQMFAVSKPKPKHYMQEKFTCMCMRNELPGWNGFWCRWQFELFVFEKKYIYVYIWAHATAKIPFVFFSYNFPYKFLTINFLAARMSCFLLSVRIRPNLHHLKVK